MNPKVLQGRAPVLPHWLTMRVASALQKPDVQNAREHSPTEEWAISGQAPSPLR